MVCVGALFPVSVISDAEVASVYCEEHAKMFEKINLKSCFRSIYCFWLNTQTKFFVPSECASSHEVHVNFNVHVSTRPLNGS